ncbi:tetratricopeptide repeat protein [Streptomyces sp. NPDC002795]|uniref:tetratricopeptide repeat protein n=1 Tax=Streptomyces sp. NPDC002795 TaxID=3364665 RepID=UPI0036C2FA3B
MRRLLSAAGAAVAVAACVAGLLALGPDDSTPGGAPRAGAAASGGGDLPAAGAVRAARDATERHPDDPTSWSRLGTAQIEAARTTLDAGRLEAAGKALHRSLDLRPEENYAAVIGLGQLANAKHDFTEGRTQGLRSTRMAPDRPDGYAVLADAEIQLGHYPAARTAVQRLLDLAPGSAAYSRAAYDLETHGRERDAAIALDRALESASTPDESAFAESRSGELAWSSGDIPRAEGHFRRALGLVPDHPYATSGLARVRAAQGRTEEALKLYDRLVERTPVPQFLVESLELRLAAAESKGEGKRDPGIAAARAALDAQLRMAQAAGGPVDPHLALYAADHADPAVAVKLLSHEAEQSRSVIVDDALGWALHRAGQDRKALTHAREAARTGWDNPLFQYHRGAIEAALDNPDAATHLRAALDRNPHFSAHHAPRAAALLAR